ncbi:MAG TPA: type II toxin-antitoxin system VapC family toxin [Geminicoccaceae bacterium]|nr:type II toxin-antitoxin system VapC family toxin [Geminicoccaceae bacterium]
MEAASARGINDAQFDDIVIRIADGPIDCRPLRPLGPRAAALARELDHPIYDCLYLAQAEEKATMVTADRRLVGAVRGTALAERVSPFGRLAER